MEQRKTYQTDLSLQCRLCSAHSNLISLFKGRNKLNRTYLVMMVQETIGIQYEEDDYYKHICITCVTFIYNAYVFRMKSLQNAEILETMKKNRNPEYKKKVPTQLRNIGLLDFNDMKETIKTWIMQKANRGSENILNTRSEKCLSSKPMIDAAVQTKSPLQFNVSVQATCIRGTLKTDTSSQTKITQVNNTAVQCTIINHVDKIYDVVVQKPHILLNKCDIGKDTIVNKDISDKPISNDSKKRNNHLQTFVDRDLFKFKQGKEIEPVKTKTAVRSNFCVNLKNNNLLTKHNQLQDIERELQSGGDKKPLTVDCEPVDLDKGELISPKDSIMNSSIHLKTSPNYASSHVSGNLEVHSPSYFLQCHKVDILISCLECDRIMYSQEEYTNHMKTHMRCSLCRKKFKSIEKTKEHSVICKAYSTKAVIEVERLEDNKDIREHRPDIIDKLRGNTKRKLHNGCTATNTKEKKSKSNSQ